MTKQNIKNSQIEISEMEKKLADITHETLVLLLEHMSEDERSKLSGESLDICTALVSINSSELIYVDTDTDEEFSCDLGELSQIQQKEIIDQVLVNIWHI